MIEYVGDFIGGLGTLEYVLVVAAVTGVVLSCVLGPDYLRLTKERKAERRAWAEAADNMAKAMAALDIIERS